MEAKEIMIIQYDEKHDVLDYDEEAKKFEQFSGYTIPDDYLEFLKLNGTGLFPKPGFYDELMEIGTFYAFNIDKESDDENNIIYVNKQLQMDGRLTENILAFAETSDCHNIFCLVLDGVHKGKILLLGDDNLLLNDGYVKSDIDEHEDLLDENITEFLDKLK